MALSWWQCDMISGSIHSGIKHWNLSCYSYPIVPVIRRDSNLTWRAIRVEGYGLARPRNQVPVIVPCLAMSEPVRATAYSDFIPI